MKCKYCHQPAGFFSFKHKECEQKHLASMNEIKKVILEKLSESSSIEYDSLKNELSTIISSGFVTDKDLYKKVAEILNELLKNKVTSVDGVTLKAFIFSLPEKLKNKVISTDYYNDFWPEFFKSYFLKDDNTRIDDYKDLIYSIKSNEEMSKK